jgi:hypothetical protein
MLGQGKFTISDIAEATELSIEQIEELKKQNNSK